MTDYQLFGNDDSTPQHADQEQISHTDRTDRERIERPSTKTPRDDAEATWAEPDVDQGEAIASAQLGLGIDLPEQAPATPALAGDVPEPSATPPDAARVDAHAIWHAVLDELAMTLSANEFQTWVRDSWAVAYEDGELIVAVPSPYTSDWLNCRLRDRIQWALRDIAKRTIAVKFRVQQAPPAHAEDVSDTPLYAKQEAVAEFSMSAPGRPQAPGSASPDLGTGTPDPSTAAVRPEAAADAGLSSSALGTGHRVPPSGQVVRYSTQLNAHYTFESFVIGNNNRMAEAAAMAVADAPGQRFNPLFIYGGVGLGKTHLLHAIGNRAQQLGRQVLYCSSETFTNDLIGAIRSQRTQEFRNKYRQVDILLIDDIQFIGGKESTQEEFFHTFNDLHANGRQIVLTSDRPPKALATLEERLRSRFEGGVQTDISRPDFETRVAILQSKAFKLGLQTSQDVLALIAERIDSNVRELEGALNQLALQLDLHNRRLTYNEAAAMLETITPNRTPCPPAHVLEIVADYFGLTVNDLVGARRTKAIAWPRQIAMYLLREENQLSLPAIGGYLGNRDHTTIRYGVERIAEQLGRDDELRQTVIALREKIYMPFMR